jgi:hypothetical protein
VDLAVDVEIYSSHGRISPYGLFWRSIAVAHRPRIVYGWRRICELFWFEG